MDRLLENLTINIHKNKSLSVLLGRLDTYVIIRTPDDCYIVDLINGEVSRCNGDLKEKAGILITGSEEAFLELLNGKIKLRTALKQNTVSLKSSVRTVLLLESILYLGIGGLSKNKNQPV